MADIIDLSQMHDKVTQQMDDDEVPVVQFQHGISIIVVVDHAGIPFLKALPSLLPQKFLREVLIIDRGCPEAVAQVLTKIAEEVPVIRFIEGKYDLSRAQCYNLGAKRAHGKYLLFVDQHAVLPKDTTIKMLYSLSSKPDKPTIISANLQGLGNKIEPEHDLLDPKQATLKLMGLNKPMTATIPSVGEDYHVSSVAPGCFLIGRSHFWLSEGFDESLGQAATADLCLKMHLQGGGVYQLKNLDVRLYPQARSVRAAPIQQNLQWIKYYLKHYKKSPTRRWLIPLSALFILRGFFKKLVSFFTFKKKEKAEPSLAELLNRQRVA